MRKVQELQKKKEMLELQKQKEQKEQQSKVGTLSLFTHPHNGDISSS